MSVNRSVYGLVWQSVSQSVCGWETERVAWWLGTVSECVTVLRLASSWEYVRADLWVSESGSGLDSEKDIVLDTSLGTELDIVWGTEWVSM